MNNCRLSTNLAYGMIIYIMASVFYLLRTRTIGTPFNDSLSAEQKKIKKQSSNERKNVFYLGIILASTLIYFVPPFKPCSCIS